MDQTNNMPELLAPAGSFAHLKAAVNAGADAVYMGGRQYSARAYAENFSKEEILEALRYAHFYEKKLYLTVNTLMKEKELEEQLYDFLLPLYEAGLDGVIVQDLGAADLIRRHFPGMKLHGSTQMTITDVCGARAAGRLGLKRIVAARELGLSELRAIKQGTALELEVFVHGALCYCYSGQCLLSSFYGGRSGNRGRCAQPCRLPYRYEGQERHFLSPKDLCALEVLPDLIEIGVDSLKIEGRMKNVDYVAGVTAIYRSCLDACRRRAEDGTLSKWRVKKEDIALLEELYSRGDGFTEGYFKQHNGKSMMSTAHPRNLGRKIGHIGWVSGGRIGLVPEEDVCLHPRDLLIIPLKNGEETALTVPAAIDQDKERPVSFAGQKKKRRVSASRQGGEGLVLNVPNSERLKKGMPVYRRKNARLSARIRHEILEKERKYPVSGTVTVKEGQPVTLTLSGRGETVELVGAPPERAVNTGVSREDISRQMHKTGGVPFTLIDLHINLDENLFVPLSKIKEMRQQAYSLLQTKAEAKKFSLQSIPKNDNVILLNNDDYLRIGKKMALVCDERGLARCIASSFFDGICLPFSFWEEKTILEQADRIVRKGKRAYFSLPEVFRPEERPSFLSRLGEICRSPLWAGIFAHNLGEAQFLYELYGRTAPIFAGASFYHWNRRSVRVTRECFGIAAVELPSECSAKEVEDVFFRHRNRPLDFDAAGSGSRKSEALVPLIVNVYGRVPLMSSAQCPKKTAGQCDKRSGLTYLTDKEGRRLPVTSHCGSCYSLIWSDRPRSSIGSEAGFLRDEAVTFRFDFLPGDSDEMDAVIRSFTCWEQEAFRFTGKNPLPPGAVPDPWHNRGVE